MKINLPITQKEVFLEPGKPIVTKTDLKGAITYANESFVSISGFSREELVSHNHNVVRHPDMPPEAFEDLWLTIKAGQPWRGLVKNRSKIGDHYWVEAFVTPITVDGRTVGYQSVRNAPKREEVAAAEPGFLTLYPDKVYITQVKEVNEGLELLKALVEAINATWEHRAELATPTASRRAPRWLDIWPLLPQTNCKQCGEATCMAFAAAILQEKRLLSECVPLQSDAAFFDRRATLEAML